MVLIRLNCIPKKDLMSSRHVLKQPISRGKLYSVARRAVFPCTLYRLVTMRTFGKSDTTGKVFHNFASHTQYKFTRGRTLYAEKWRDRPVKAT